MGRETLTVLGATGYTGRLVAAEAARRGLPLRLAGRDRRALDALASMLGGGVDVAVADVRDAGALAALAATTGVLVSTVGPYAELGRPAVEAALEGGCHYVDVAGEPGHVAAVRADGDRAAAAGVRLCPGAGFEGATGDLLVRLAAEALGGAVEAVRVGYLLRPDSVLALLPSAGTARAMLGVAAGGGLALVDGQVATEPLLASRWTIPFPEPLGAVAGVSFPGPEVLTAAATAGARQARAYVALPAGGTRAGGGLAALARPLGRAGASLAASRAGAVLGRATRVLPAGPSRLARERTLCAVLAEVSGPAGSRRAWLRLRDLYGASARLAVGVGARLLAGTPGAGGVLTPAQAAGDAGGLLTEAGARWEVVAGGAP